MSPPLLRIVEAANASPMTLSGTRTFLLGRVRPVVIDPGPAKEEHLDRIEAALGGVRPAAILLTHGHPDHAAGAPALARRTGAPVWMAPGALGSSPAEVTHWVGDGDEIETDAGPVRAVATPGHSPEHVAYWWPGGSSVFVGDLLMGEGDTTLVAPPEGDLAAYLDSLDRVEGLGAAVLYPAHGPPLRDPSSALARYRAHRRARIEQVRQARAAHPRAAPGELVTAIYGAELHPGLRGAAEGSVRAVLAYLERGAD